MLCLLHILNKKLSQVSEVSTRESAMWALCNIYALDWLVSAFTWLYAGHVFLVHELNAMANTKKTSSIAKDFLKVFMCLRFMLNSERIFHFFTVTKKRTNHKG